MAYIEGLRESEQALEEIRKIIKEVEAINQFLMVENPTMHFKLSFEVKNPAFVEDIAPVVPEPDQLQTDNMDSGIASAEKPKAKKSKKQKKMIQYSTPLLCDNKEGLYYFIRLYKERKVRTVYQLADVHRIHLTEEEHAILDS